MKKSKIIWSIFLVVQIIILNIVSFFPEAIEKYYSNGFYLWISKISRTLFGSLPFSFGDIAYTVLICFLIYRLYKRRAQLFSWTSWKMDWKSKDQGLAIYRRPLPPMLRP